MELQLQSIVPWYNIRAYLVCMYALNQTSWIPDLETVYICVIRFGHSRVRLRRFEKYYSMTPPFPLQIAPGEKGRFSSAK